VVALNSGGTPQLVAHGQSGLLSEPGNVEELASHILQLIRDPRLRAKMGACGRARVEEHFTPARLAGDVECVYARMLGLSS
jgi:glycosyltransferase involved in cell wall biosynthesis